MNSCSSPSSTFFELQANLYQNQEELNILDSLFSWENSISSSNCYDPSFFVQHLLNPNTYAKFSKIYHEPHLYNLNISSEDFPAYFCNFLASKFIAYAIHIDELTGRLDFSISILRSAIDSLSNLHSTLSFSQNSSANSILLLKDALHKLNLFKNILFLFNNASQKFSPFPKFPLFESQNARAILDLCFSSTCLNSSSSSFLSQILPNANSLTKYIISALKDDPNFSLHFLKPLLTNISIFISNSVSLSKSLPLQLAEKALSECSSAWNFWTSYITQICRLFLDDCFYFVGNTNTFIIFNKGDLFEACETFQTSSLNTYQSDSIQLQSSFCDFILLPGVCITINLYSSSSSKLSITSLLNIERLLAKYSEKLLLQLPDCPKVSNSTLLKNQLQKANFLLNDYTFNNNYTCSYEIDLSDLSQTVCTLLNHIKFYLILNEFELNPSSFSWFLLIDFKENGHKNLLIRLCNSFTPKITIHDLDISDRSILWSNFYNQVLQLWDNGHGLLSSLSEDEITSQVYKAILLSKDIELAKLCLEPQTTQLGSSSNLDATLADIPFIIPFSVGKSIILQVSQEISNNSNSGNIESPDIVNAISYLALIKGSPEYARENKFLEAVHLLWSLSSSEFYDFQKLRDNITSSALKLSVPSVDIPSAVNNHIVPIKVRTANSIPNLIDEVLSLNPLAYKKQRLVREAAQLLGYIPTESLNNSPLITTDADQDGTQKQSSLSLGVGIAKMGKIILETAQGHSPAFNLSKGARPKSIETIEEAHIISLMLKHAVKNKDFDSAYEFVKQLEKIPDIISHDEDLLDYIWHQIIYFETSLEQNDARVSEVAALALKICPKTGLSKSVETWKSVHKESVKKRKSESTSSFGYNKSPKCLALNKEWWFSTSLDILSNADRLNPLNMIGFNRGNLISSQSPPNILSSRSLSKDNSQGEALLGDKGVFDQNYGQISNIPQKINRPRITLTKEHMRTTDVIIIEQAFGNIQFDSISESDFNYRLGLLDEFLNFRFSFEENRHLYAKKKKLDEYILSIITSSQKLCASICSLVKSTLGSVSFLNVSLCKALQDEAKLGTGASTTSEPIKGSLADFCGFASKVFEFSGDTKTSKQLVKRLNMLNSFDSVISINQQNQLYQRLGNNNITIGGFFTSLLGLRHVYLFEYKGDFVLNFVSNFITFPNYLQFLKNLDTLAPVFESEIINDMSSPASISVASQPLFQKTVYVYFFEVYGKDIGNTDEFSSALVEMIFTQSSNDLAFLLFEEILFGGMTSKTFVSLETKYNAISLFFSASKNSKTSYLESIFGSLHNAIFLKIQWILTLYEISRLYDPYKFRHVSYEKWIVPLEPFVLVSQSNSHLLINKNIEPSVSYGYQTDQKQSYKANDFWNWIHPIPEISYSFIPQLIAEKESMYFVFSVITNISEFLARSGTGIVLDVLKIFQNAFDLANLTEDQGAFLAFYDNFLFEYSDLLHTDPYISSIPELSAVTFSDAIAVDRNHMFKKLISDTHEFLSKLFVKTVTNESESISSACKLKICELLTFKYANFIRIEALDEGLIEKFRVTFFELCSQNYFHDFASKGYSEDNIEILVEVFISLLKNESLISASEGAENGTSNIQSIKLLELVVGQSLINTEKLGVLLSQPVQTDSSIRSVYFDLLGILIKNNFQKQAYLFGTYMLSLNLNLSEEFYFPEKFALKTSFLKPEGSADIYKDDPGLYLETLSTFLLYSFCDFYSRDSLYLLYQSDYFFSFLQNFFAQNYEINESSFSTRKYHSIPSKYLLMVLGVLVYGGLSLEKDMAAKFLSEIIKVSTNFPEILFSVMDFCFQMITDYGLSHDSTIYECFNEILIQLNDPGSFDTNFNTELLDSFFDNNSAFESLHIDFTLENVFSSVLFCLYNFGQSDLFDRYFQDWARIKSPNKDIKALNQRSFTFDKVVLFFTTNGFGPELAELISSLTKPALFKETEMNQDIEIPKRSLVSDISYEQPDINETVPVVNLGISQDPKDDNEHIAKEPPIHDYQNSFEYDKDEDPAEPKIEDNWASEHTNALGLIVQNDTDDSIVLNKDKEIDPFEAFGTGLEEIEIEQPEVQYPETVVSLPAFKDDINNLELPASSINELANVSDQNIVNKTIEHDEKDENVSKIYSESISTDKALVNDSFKHKQIPNLSYDIQNLDDDDFINLGDGWGDLDDEISPILDNSDFFTHQSYLQTVEEVSSQPDNFILEAPSKTEIETNMVKQSDGISDFALEEKQHSLNTSSKSFQTQIWAILNVERGKHSKNPLKKVPAFIHRIQYFS
ncbi:hypothetical protein BB560_004626 [Smittium megazygosporum]|uniref:Uncharacterized protein n=1 Tax=Smittium megazygosporum TaxID=133381 RepID=A0A2T9Z8U2_9FUNG|nr:hypothetical protein BB560_004626 [Smittium megazygosporum]